MPLYMDYHIFTEVTIDEVKEAHMADLSVQEKYDVKYHQFWVNEEAGTVFCLIEGPSKEACEHTHREAHGNIACNLVEVEPGFFELVMGHSHEVDKFGIVRNVDGSIDLGYRFMLVVDIHGGTDIARPDDYKRLILSGKPKKLVKNLIRTHRGNDVNTDRVDTMIGVFRDSQQALSCAIELREELANHAGSGGDGDPEWDIRYKIGLCGGQPLTEEGGFFERVMRVGRRLCLAAGHGEILASDLINKMCDPDAVEGLVDSVRFINVPEEQFLNDLLDIVERNLSDSDFTVKGLSRNIGMSRPQLYRRITAISGRSPNHLIRDVRMHKALELIQERQYNISEVSLLVGFNNPSYFSKCFQDKYGIAPSKVAG